MHDSGYAPGGLDDGFGHWLAGFIDGEGCFSIDVHRPGREGGTSSYYYCQFRLKLRDDDGPILEECLRRTGIGTLKYRPRNDSSKPGVEWLVHRKRDILALVKLLDRYPLRARKAQDYEVWRRGVMVWAKIKRGPPRTDFSELLTLRDELREIRRYRERVAA